MTIRKTLFTAAACGTLAFTASQATAAPSLAEGDLFVGFYMINTAGTGVEANTYIFDLGTAAFYRENTTNLISISNIGTDLVTAFGANWFDNDRLRWGVVGAVSANVAGTISGDPIRTNYLSRAVLTLGTQAAIFPTINAANRGALATNINDVRLANNGLASTVNPDGAIVATSVENDFSQKVPPTTGNFFGQGNNLLGSFNGSNFGLGTGGYTVEGVLDLQRVLNTTADGADLTSGFGTPITTAGVGQFIGTFTIDSAGQLRLDVVPEPSTIGLLALSGLVIASRRRRQNRA